LPNPFQVHGAWQPQAIQGYAMIESLTFLLLAQLAGEIIVRAIGLPVPGPVIGLAIMTLAAICPRRQRRL
jgi:putative effector of murein hydrolase LrgA (UPF0299 family)